MNPNVGQAKKPQLMIKPFKVAPSVPTDFEEKTWSKLRSAVVAISSKTAIAISKEELYRAVEDLCLQKLSAPLYDKLKSECNGLIKKKVDSLVLPSVEYSAFLDVVDSVWNDHCEQMSTIRNIFLYLDRSYAFQSNSAKPLWEMGVDLFRKSLDCNIELENKIIMAILAEIDADRQGLEVDRGRLRRILLMLSSMGLYSSSFERAFLLDSNRFYLTEGQSLVESVDTATFLQRAEKRIHEAHDMVVKYLDVSTKKGLISIIENRFLAPHVGQVVERGLTALLDADKVVDLRRMYQLFERVNACDAIKQSWVAHIRRAGEALVCVTDPAREKTMIEDLLSFQERMDVILKSSFGYSEPFKQALKSAFEQFMNARQNRPAELLAKFVDRKLRGEKGLDDMAVEGMLEKATCLFRYLNGKDTFEAFYKKMLSKRLLLRESASDDLERFMVTKLKTECGPNFTAKLEGMFQDVGLSRDIMAAYSAYCAGQQMMAHVDASSSSDAGSRPRRAEPEAHIQVLTTGYWPAFPSSESIILPPEIRPVMDNFTTFYTNKYQGRRLAWAHSLERCVMTAHFPKGKRELEVSFYQALVLLSFNKAESLSYLDIQGATRMEDGELKRVLQSLACGVISTRVLTKSPRGKEVESSDEFSYNGDFTNKLFRIKINSIQLRETVEDTERTHDEVFRDRQYQVDAVVVRTMKARKRLSHNELISELMVQLKFPARTADLKKRIESLIEREYLERDNDDSTVYNYLA